MRRKGTFVGATLMVVAETVVVARRRGYLVGANAVVRCRKGHLFTTLWIPGASLKSLRFVFWRYQRCPVGPHWTLVTPARMAELTDAEKHLAAETRDIRIP